MSNQERDHRAMDAGAGDSGHDEWEELAVGYALAALEPDELNRFVDHLVIFCPQCHRSVTDTEIVGAGLASALSVEPPSLALRESVLAAALLARPAVPQTSADLAVLADRPRSHATVPPPVRTDTDTVVELSHRRDRRFKPVSTGWLAAAAAGLVAIVLAATTWSAVQGRNHQKSLADGGAAAISAITAAPGQVVPLRKTDGTMVAMVVARPDSVSVVADGITANSAATSYVLWGIKTNNAPVALGVFDANGTKLQTTQVATDSRGAYTAFNAFAISHEPGHTPPAKPSAVVALGNA